MTENEPRVTVITGGGTGLGAAYARYLSGRGDRLAVMDRDDPRPLVDELQVEGREVVGWAGDAAEPRDVESFVGHVLDTWSRVDVLINNVGISPYKRFEDIGYEEWRDVMRVNIDSAFLLSRACLPSMLDHGWGRILNVSTSVCWDPSLERMTHYATSKMALVGLTRSLSVEVADSGVTVNAIAPGLVRTPLLSNRLPQEHFEASAQRQSIHRTIEPDDLLAAVAFLVSDGAAMVTGTVLPINGGQAWL